MVIVIKPDGWSLSTFCSKDWRINIFLLLEGNPLRYVREFTFAGNVSDLMIVFLATQAWGEQQEA